MREDGVQENEFVTVSSEAHNLHQKAVVVDGHIDTLLEIVNGKVDGIGKRNSLIHVDQIGRASCRERV